MGLRRTIKGIGRTVGKVGRSGVLGPVLGGTLGRLGAKHEAKEAERKERARMFGLESALGEGTTKRKVRRQAGSGEIEFTEES